MVLFLLQMVVSLLSINSKKLIWFEIPILILREVDTISGVISVLGDECYGQIN
jgi:hypothetical protein